jgi:hypothetical protein
MNATAIAEAAVSKAMGQRPVLRTESELAGREASVRSPSQRLPVWEERARKMGFPPSQR